MSGQFNQRNAASLEYSNGAMLSWLHGPAQEDTGMETFILLKYSNVFK